MSTSITLKQYTDRIAETVNGAPGLRGQWVTAETSDLRRGAHCYLELVQKDPSTGEIVAKLRATIWRTAMGRIDAEFEAATGTRLASGMKVMVYVSASFHPAYGLSANITAIDPAYTMGDLMRQRMEILARLKAEGVLTLNRELEWPTLVQRIAVVSAPGAAGFGDFIHQLFNTSSRLRFSARLFPALMQGTQAAESIIAALDRVAEEDGEWDCVVIIRGGGATSDLAAFENYELASNIAQFPIPVIIGIGHERDITVLDYVANMRVKTPTAAAEWLIERGEMQLTLVDQLASAIHRTASAILAGSKEQLARYSAALPHLPVAALDRATKRLDRATVTLNSLAQTKIQPQYNRLISLETRLAATAQSVIDRRRARLDTLSQLLAVLSPEATLRRGYSITRVNGQAVTSVTQVTPGDTIETTLADGTVNSKLLINNF